MKEEKYIQSLFEIAKKEDPKLSFEAVTQNLDASLNPGMAIVLKDWFLNNIYLNSILAILITLVLSVTVFSDSQTDQNQNGVFAKTNDSLHAIAEDQYTYASIEESEDQKIENLEVKREDKIDIKETQTKQTSFPTPTIDKATIKVEAKETLVNTEKKIISEKPVNEPVKKISNKKIVETVKAKKQSQSVKQDVRIESKKGIQSDLEIILETALNSNGLKNEVFAKNEKNEFNQLIIVTNDAFNNLINVNFSGKKVIVVRSLYSESFNIINNEFVNIKEFKVNESQALMDFEYNAIKVHLKLEKTDNLWICKEIIKDVNQQDFLVKKELVQMALDHAKMNTLVGQNKKGEFKTFALLANGHLPSKIVFNFKGKNLELVPNVSSSKYSKRIKYMKISKLLIKRKKASLTLSYLGKISEITYRKKDGAWAIHSFKHNTNQ